MLNFHFVRNCRIWYRNCEPCINDQTLVIEDASAATEGRPTEAAQQLMLLATNSPIKEQQIIGKSAAVAAACICLQLATRSDESVEQFGCSGLCLHAPKCNIVASCIHHKVHVHKHSLKHLGKGAASAKKDTETEENNREKNSMEAAKLARNN